MRYPDGSFDDPEWFRRRIDGTFGSIGGWSTGVPDVLEVELGYGVWERIDGLEEAEDVRFWADLAVLAGLERVENPGYDYRLALDRAWWEALSPELRARMADRCPPGCAP